MRIDRPTRIQPTPARTIAFCCGLVLAAAPAWAGETTRLSVATDGSQATAGSGGNIFGSLNAAGTVAVFRSEATDLVADDTNGALDVFVRDVRRSTTTRVSVASDGTEANGLSHTPTVSANGRWVAFTSDATNLVPGDTNGAPDVFRHDRQTGVTERVSVNSAGIQCNNGATFPVISGTGQAVVFASTSGNLVPDDTNATYDVFHRDMRSGQTTRVSVANDGSEGNDVSLYPAPSANGKLVAFLSMATNLVAGDTNGIPDIFIRDLRKGTTVRVNVASDGTEADGGTGTPAISANGRVVAFTSPATGLVPGDTNGRSDAFVHDVRTGVTERVSLASDGTEANGDASSIAISGNGRFVAFISGATNLVPSDTNGKDDVFLHDRVTGQTVRVNVDGAGVQSTGVVGFDLSVNASGSRVLFSSTSPALVLDDTNGVEDLFMRDLRK